MTAKDTSGTLVDAWSYAYDPVGNRTSKTNKDGKAETYQYDSVYRLTRAAYTNGTFEAFTYDPAGNRLTRQDGAGTITYSYDVANQMLTGGTDSYIYDANGNVTTKTTGGGAATTFAYDFNNRITQITAPTASETSQYSPDGTRVSVNAAGVGGAIGPVYDSIGNPVLDMDGVASVGIYRLYGPGIDEPLGEWRRLNNQTNFLHHDALNSVTMVSNLSGAVQYRIAYTVFGERTQTAPPTGTVPTRLSHTSRENSVGSLMQYRARYYEASLGRFFSQDVHQGDDATPPSLHRYLYTLNNPVRYTDPSGNELDKIIFNIVDSALGAAGLAFALFGGVATAVAVGIALAIISLILAAYAYSKGWISGFTFFLYVLLLAASVIAAFASGGLATIAAIAGVLIAVYLLWSTLRYIFQFDIERMRREIEAWLATHPLENVFA